jgi:hypothetical protein
MESEHSSTPSMRVKGLHLLRSRVIAPTLTAGVR